MICILNWGSCQAPKILQEVIKIKINIKLLMSLIVIVIISSFIGSYYYLSKIKPYNQSVNTANVSMDKEEYDKAITQYEEALSFKKDAGVNKKLDLARLLVKSKAFYETAIKLVTDKNYLEAVYNFKKVDELDKKRYSEAQSKISDCKKLYIEVNLKGAKDDLASGNFDKANILLANIVKIDPNNADVKKAKADIAKAIKKQKDNAVAAIAQAKTAAEAKVAAEAKALTEAKAKAEVAKGVTLAQAEDILKTNKYVLAVLGSDAKTEYTPDDNYVPADLKSQYYIFSYGGAEWTADSNICIDKKTGNIYIVMPTDSGSQTMTIEDYSKPKAQ